MPRVITTLQAMSHPTVVATINCLSEMTQRLQDENDELKKSWVGLTKEERKECIDWAYDLDGTTFAASLAKMVEYKLKEKNT